MGASYRIAGATLVSIVKEEGARVSQARQGSLNHSQEWDVCIEGRADWSCLPLQFSRMCACGECEKSVSAHKKGTRKGKRKASFSFSLYPLISPRTTATA